VPAGGESDAISAAASGEPFAAGREADVFLLDDVRVLRRYRYATDTTHEAEVMAYAADHGYPVPAVYAARGSDMVLERLRGPTMARAELSGEMSLREGAAMLADLLRRLHELPPRSGQDDSAANDRSVTNASTATNPSNSTGATSASNPTGATNTSSATGETIVHLDLHPENVLLTERGPVVIDWRNAGDGPADLDTALTALILAQVAIGSIEHPLGAAAGEMLDRFLELAPGDPTRLLNDAVSRRRRQSTMSPEEVAALGTAAARVLSTKTARVSSTRTARVSSAKIDRPAGEIPPGGQ
jgi:aminoglycoside phosphotransferase (APT) family kinase protein